LDPEVLALAAGIAQLFIVALDAPGRVPRDGVAGFDDVREMPEVVHALGDQRGPLFAPFDLLSLGNSHTRISGALG
jgi:hypothetical protein